MMPEQKISVRQTDVTERKIRRGFDDLARALKARQQTLFGAAFPEKAVFYVFLINFRVFGRFSRNQISVSLLDERVGGLTRNPVLHFKKIIRRDLEFISPERIAAFGVVK